MLSGSIRQQVNQEIVLSEKQTYGILVECGVTVKSNLDTHFLVFCPFHFNTNSPACEVDKTKGLYFCFSCGATGNIYDLVMQTLNLTYFQAVRLIKKHESDIDIMDFVEKEIEEKQEFQEFDGVVLERLSKAIEASSRANEYYESRGINKASIDEFQLGYSEKQDMVTVPVHTPDGRCIGFVARSIVGKDFKNTPGLPRNRVLFNYHRLDSKAVAVVESSFDAIRLHQVGLPAVATLGSKISRQQIALLDKFSEIVIMSDNDSAGMVLADSIKKNLSHKFIRQVEWPDGTKDVGDLKDNQIIEQYNNAKDILSIMLGEK